MTTKVYQGSSTVSSDQIYTIEKGKFYRGKSTISSDEIKNPGQATLRIDGNKVYKGKSNISSDQIMTIDKCKIYKGRNTISTDQVANYSGDRLTDSEFMTLICLIAQRNNML